MELENNLRILKLYPSFDVNYPSFIGKNYNYHVNYDIWDKINGDKAILGDKSINFNNYDIVFLPMYKRWEGKWELLDKIKESSVKTVLFDNDSHYREFSHPFYKNIDLIFYRNIDKNNNIPFTKNMWLKFSIDTNKYLPQYGGEGILFNCTIAPIYPYRLEIFKKRLLNHTNYVGENYIQSIQSSAAALHTALPSMAHAKILEFASCGTQIISNRSEKMDSYFPKHLIIYFDSLEELKKIITTYKPNIEIQKELRYVVETKHDSRIRAKEIIDKIKEIL